jgi:hypothetical protein
MFAKSRASEFVSQGRSADVSASWGRSDGQSHVLQERDVEVLNLSHTNSSPHPKAAAT